MSSTIMLIPIGYDVGLSSVKLGIKRAMEHRGANVNIFKPISDYQLKSNIKNCTYKNFIKNNDYLLIKPLQVNHVNNYLACNKKDALMEKIVEKYYTFNKKDIDLVLIEGFSAKNINQFIIWTLNYEIAQTINADVVFVISHNKEDTLEQLKERINIVYNEFNKINVAGVIINKLNSPIDKNSYTNFIQNANINFFNKTETLELDHIKLKEYISLPILGLVPWNLNLRAIRVVDVFRYLNACLINKGDMYIRRVKSIIFCTHNIPNVLDNVSSEAIWVIPADYNNLVIKAYSAIINGIKISAILLVGSYKIDSICKTLSKCVFETGLSVFNITNNIWDTFLYLQKFTFKVSHDDTELLEKVTEYVSGFININWIKSVIRVNKKNNHLYSPPEFKYRLTELANQENKRIVLPEGNEPRTIKAAVICAQKKIATCILLGNPDEITFVANSMGLKLDLGIEIIDPKVIYKDYVERLIELRKNKGMNEDIALKYLKSNIVLGTLMLEQNKVDGMVSGAIHTTADTIRPSLQIIKTAPGCSLISSIFFMLFPKQVYIYGDCAINPNPTAAQLAEIAIQSAKSAIMFDIEPRVAMLSYATGSSSLGKDVEKIYEAIHLVKNKYHDIIIDGPLQYDAAVMDDVAKSKAPYSLVAGQATVFIFPDLNSGNITYKAVQRSANLISIGPMLQGIGKPVNDLSRGASVDDIVYTIAITAIQAINL